MTLEHCDFAMLLDEAITLGFEQELVDDFTVRLRHDDLSILVTIPETDCYEAVRCEVESGTLDAYTRELLRFPDEGEDVA